MAKGRKLPTPLDPEEREQYKMKRAKNNQSAANHRERTRQQLAEKKKLDEKCFQLATDLEKEKRLRLDAEAENKRLLNLFFTHDCVSSTEHREQLYNTFHGPRSVSSNFSSELSRSSSLTNGSSSPSIMNEFFTTNAPQQQYQIHSPYSSGASNWTGRSESVGSATDSSSSPMPSLSSPYQPQMDARPGNFWLDNFTSRENPTGPSSSGGTWPKQYASFDEFMKAKTGHTPLPGQKLCTPLADLMDMPKKAGACTVSKPSDSSSVNNQEKIADADAVPTPSDASWDLLIDQELSPGSSNAIPVLSKDFTDMILSPALDEE